MRENAQSKLKESITSFKFRMELENRYPYRDPKIMCLTDFADPSLSLCDGRDIFTEVVGDKGWQCNLDIYKIIWLIPDFVEDIVD